MRDILGSGFFRKNHGHSEGYRSTPPKVKADQGTLLVQRLLFCGQLVGNRQRSFGGWPCYLDEDVEKSTGNEDVSVF